MWTVKLRTATGDHEPMQIPRDLEGDTAVESAANLLREIADEQKKLPARLRAFRPPLTIVVEEIADPTTEAA
jgi:hypothetical protein